MKNFFRAASLGLLVPYFVFSQVQVHKTSPSTVVNIIPFYSQTLLTNTNTASVPFTRPSVQQGSGVPHNLNIDTSYDNLDDTTYESTRIFDAGRVISTNYGLSSGNWQSTSYGSVWCLNITIQDALNNSVRFNGLSLSPTANLYVLNGDLQMIKGPYTHDMLPSSGNLGTFPMNGSSCYIFLQETDPNNTYLDALTVGNVVGGVQSIDDDINGASSSYSAPQGKIGGGAITNGTVSNSCVPSIRCFEDWMTTARAVSRWSNGAGAACSGTLLNKRFSLQLDENIRFGAVKFKALAFATAGDYFVPC